MNTDWSQHEVRLIVEDYFDMLTSELKRKPYNKSAHRKELIKLLDGRNEGSIEFKHRNITAALKNMGLPGIKGYKPLGNYQRVLLESEINSYIQLHRPELEMQFEVFSNESTDGLPMNPFSDIDSLLVEPPESSDITQTEPIFRPTKTNYLEKEQSNRQLGEKGEEFVIAYERHRLIKAGKDSLVEKIEWVSKEKGDGAGYDILSKNDNGTDRYIEVKTTKLSIYTPIFFSKNELEFSNRKENDFYLYRVFNFSQLPKLFIVQGKYESFCRVIPQTFKGIF